MHRTGVRAWAQSGMGSEAQLFAAQHGLETKVELRL